ncbi:MAG: hypothetical protein CMH13_00160 [Martelella sp.]|nr:hypothetical protein [Martelella sp.]|tara:strand:- start:271 stop:480 length:210 start_codon:yes stop_codon:yes gene_type:complete
MAKSTKVSRSAGSGKFITRPIGVGKAERFAAVEGLSLKPASRSLSKSLASSNLKGDAYRTAVTKAFKKG